MTLSYDILNPTRAHQAKTHKLKRLIQRPNSFFMDVKCAACQHINILYSHANTPVPCSRCKMVICQPTGGLARLSEGVSFRKKPQ